MAARFVSGPEEPRSGEVVRKQCQQVPGEILPSSSPEEFFLCQITLLAGAISHLIVSVLQNKLAKPELNISVSC
jgi:hypothetical protein